MADTVTRSGLTDAEYQALDDRLLRIFKIWTHRLGLGWWHVKYVLDTDAASFEVETDPRDSAAFRSETHMEVITDWQRLNATVRVNAYAVKDMSDEDLAESVVHELCHVLVSEMRIPDWADAPSQVLHSQHDHEERVVVMLTKAFGWTFQAGAGELESDPEYVEPADAAKDATDAS